MRKETKGAFAAGTAAVLLLGGAGSLAYWTDAEDIEGGSVNTGSLALGTSTCGAVWVYADGNAGAGTTVTTIVPGDAVSKECTFSITATGDNLTAELTSPTTTVIPDPAGTTSFDATVAVSYEDALGAAFPTTITESNDGDVVTATITVTFPFGTDEDAETVINGNDTQGVTATLDGINVTLTQTES
ncbi:MAG: alternate-type signal peptide domain-containing protein [Nocardioides sp.]|nr:alternate-type signal peptide domain-containing protein [Nocardioides sp.]